MVLEVKPKSGTVKLVSDMDQSKPVEVGLAPCSLLLSSRANLSAC